MNVKWVSLGCAKNQVDSEEMIGRLSRAGWTLIEDPDQADVIVVNTCSFIESAADESIETILELAESKKNGKCRRLIVTGCLPQRYGEKIAEALPEVDVFLGTAAFDQIVRAAEDQLAGEKCILPGPDQSRHGLQSRVSQSSHLAYLKIAEGCNRRCTYCIIPRLRGSYRSFSPEEIEAQARALIQAGARELILVAQDTTFYGRDLEPPSNLAQLIQTLARIDRRVWIRFLYGHPDGIPDALLDVVARHANVCPYFDIPIQHVSDRILRQMGRPVQKADLKKLFARIRDAVPEVSLRTTLLVGFPGETRKDFQELEAFIAETPFDHLGIFTYSDAEDLPSHHLKAHVSTRTAAKRQERLLELQVEISAARNQRHIGRTLKVLVEEQNDEGLYLGRTMFQAPEVDGLTYIRPEKPLLIGEFAEVRITKAFEYDLLGEIE